MRTYTKINTMFMRHPKSGLIIPDEWATPEIAYLAGNLWHFHEKVDGTNIRVAVAATQGADIRPDAIAYGGKTDDAQVSMHILNMLDRKFRTEAGCQTVQKVFPSGGAILFGEGYGDKVNKQGGRAYKPGADFVLFDVLVLSDEGPLWLSRENVEDVAGNLSLDVVPLIGHGTLYDGIELVKSRFASQWGAFPIEGIVARPTVDLMSRRGERIITKLKLHDFNRLPNPAGQESKSGTGAAE